jgi:hypothetical protein
MPAPHCKAVTVISLALALTVTSPQPLRADEPSAEDTAVIESLQGQGVDLSEPLLVEFMFSFPGVQQARRVGKALAAEGFKSTVDAGGAGQDTLLLARKQVVIDAQTMGELRVRFEALARSGQGQYEGWGMP